MPSQKDKLPITISRKDYLTNGSDVEFRKSIYMIVESVSLLLKCRNAFGRALGLTANQYIVLIGVAYCQGDKGVSIKGIAEHVALASSHVTTEVGRLERKGLLRKRINVDDRRGILVSLSKHGRDAVERVAPLIRRVNDLLFDNISRSQLAAAQSVAKTLVTNAERALAELKRNERNKRSRR
jgi:DNA-binding MarR family transcriptional regulator